MCFPWLPLLPPPLEKCSPLSLISAKGKRDLWKQLREKESCLSCLVSHKSRKSICNPCSHPDWECEHQSSTHCIGQLGQKRTNATTNPLGFWKLQPMSQAWKQQYCIALPSAVPQSQQGLLSHQKFISEGDNPSQRTYQKCSWHDCQHPIRAGFYCYFLISLHSQSAWLLFKLTLLIPRQSLYQSEIKYLEKTPAETFKRPCSKLCVLISEAVLREHRNYPRVYFTSVIFPTEKECSPARILEIKYISGKKGREKRWVLKLTVHTKCSDLIYIVS